MSNFKMFLKRNSSTILTCVSAIGVAATAVVSARDTIKAVELLKKKEEPDAKLSKKEVIKTVAPAYIPTVLVGLSTMACIFGANALNKKTQASLASAYALLDQSYKEYKASAKKVYGEESDTKIKEAIMQSHYEINDAFEKKEDKQMFFDFYGLQFFNATMDEVQNAEKELNKILSRNGFVPLNTFYEMLGVECADMDYGVGWSHRSCQEYGYNCIKFIYEKMPTGDGTELTSITMVTEPVENFLEY